MEQALHAFVDAVIARLPGAAPSCYLYGSATLDDFRPGWSDIDLLILTDRALTEGEADALVSLRQTLTPPSPYFRMLEGGVVPLADFLSGQPTRTIYWGTTGQRVKSRHDLSPFDLWLLHRHGRLLRGPEVRPLLPCPARDALHAAVRIHLEGVRQHGRGDASLYAFGWLLDIARGLYTLQTGQVIAKTAAGEWALREHLCPDEDALRLALAVRRDPSLMAREDVRSAAMGLTGAIQRFADVLERSC